MGSNYFKVGALVHIITPKSHLPMNNATILEVHTHGLIVTQKGIKNGPTKFIAFEQIVDLEFVPEKAAPTMVRTAGAR